MEVASHLSHFLPDIPSTSTFNGIGGDYSQNVDEWTEFNPTAGGMEKVRREYGRWVGEPVEGKEQEYRQFSDSRQTDLGDGTRSQRRHCDVFQSEGPGHKVQVLRAQKQSHEVRTGGAGVSNKSTFHFTKSTSSSFSSSKMTSNNMTQSTSSTSASLNPFSNFNQSFENAFGPLKLSLNQLDHSTQKLKGSVGRMGSLSSRRPPSRISRASNSFLELTENGEFSDKMEDRSMIKEISNKMNKRLEEILTNKKTIMNGFAHNDEEITSDSVISTKKLSSGIRIGFPLSITTELNERLKRHKFSESSTSEQNPKVANLNNALPSTMLLNKNGDSVIVNGRSKSIDDLTTEEPEWKRDTKLRRSLRLSSENGMNDYPIIKQNSTNGHTSSDSEDFEIQNVLAKSISSDLKYNESISHQSSRVSAFNVRETIEQRKLQHKLKSNESHKLETRPQYLFGAAQSEIDTTNEDENKTIPGRHPKRTEEWYERRKSYGFESSDKYKGNKSNVEDTSLVHIPDPRRHSMAEQVTRESSIPMTKIVKIDNKELIEDHVVRRKTVITLGSTNNQAKSRSVSDLLMEMNKDKEKRQDKSRRSLREPRRSASESYKDQIKSAGSFSPKDPVVIMIPITFEDDQKNDTGYSSESINEQHTVDFLSSTKLFKPLQQKTPSLSSSPESEVEMDQSKLRMDSGQFQTKTWITSENNKLLKNMSVQKPVAEDNGFKVFSHGNMDTSNNNFNNRKIPKKVEFSKTEVHFSTEAGKFNIVETDEKKPSSTIFRRKRREKRQSEKDIESRNDLQQIRFGDAEYENWLKSENSDNEENEEDVEEQEAIKNSENRSNWEPSSLPNITSFTEINKTEDNSIKQKWGVNLKKVKQSSPPSPEAEVPPIIQNKEPYWLSDLKLKPLSEVISTVNKTETREGEMKLQQLVRSLRPTGSPLLNIPSDSEKKWSSCQQYLASRDFAADIDKLEGPISFSSTRDIISTIAERKSKWVHRMQNKYDGELKDKEETSWPSLETSPIPSMEEIIIDTPCLSSSEEHKRNNTEFTRYIEKQNENLFKQDKPKIPAKSPKQLSERLSRDCDIVSSSIMSQLMHSNVDTINTTIVDDIEHQSDHLHLLKKAKDRLKSSTPKESSIVYNIEHPDLMASVLLQQTSSKKKYNNCYENKTYSENLRHTSTDFDVTKEIGKEGLYDEKIATTGSNKCDTSIFQREHGFMESNINSEHLGHMVNRKLADVIDGNEFSCKQVNNQNQVLSSMSDKRTTTDTTNGGYKSIVWRLRDRIREQYAPNESYQSSSGSKTDWIFIQPEKRSLEDNVSPKIDSGKVHEISGIKPLCFFGDYDKPDHQNENSKYVFQNKSAPHQESSSRLIPKEKVIHHLQTEKSTHQFLNKTGLVMQKEITDFQIQKEKFHRQGRNDKSTHIIQETDNHQTQKEKTAHKIQKEKLSHQHQPEKSSPQLQTEKSSHQHQAGNSSNQYTTEKSSHQHQAGNSSNQYMTEKTSHLHQTEKSSHPQLIEKTSHLHQTEKSSHPQPMEKTSHLHQTEKSSDQIRTEKITHHIHNKIESSAKKIENSKKLQPSTVKPTNSVKVPSRKPKLDLDSIPKHISLSDEIEKAEIEELTKAADTILEAVAGYTDFSSLPQSEEENKYYKLKSSSPIPTRRKLITDKSNLTKKSETRDRFRMTACISQKSSSESIASDISDDYPVKNRYSKLTVSDIRQRRSRMMDIKEETKTRGVISQDRIAHHATPTKSSAQKIKPKIKKLPRERRESSSSDISSLQSTPSGSFSKATSRNRLGMKPDIIATAAATFPTLVEGIETTEASKPKNKRVNVHIVRSTKTPLTLTENGHYVAKGRAQLTRKPHKYRPKEEKEKKQDSKSDGELTEKVKSQERTALIKTDGKHKEEKKKEESTKGEKSSKINEKSKKDDTKQLLKPRTKPKSELTESKEKRRKPQRPTKSGNRSSDDVIHV